MTTPHHPETIDEILEMDKLEYVENKNPLRADELKDPHRVIKIELLGIIAAYQDPVCSQKIFRDYEEINGCPLDPSEFGFKSFSSMMRTFSDKFVCHQDGIRFSYTAKKTERSSHLQELIENQVSLEEKRRRDMRRARSYSRSRRSNYGAGIFYAQNFVPLLTDDRTAEQRTADNLASFGRSLAAQDARVGLDWGMKRHIKLESSEDSDSDAGGVVLRSKSVPPSRAMHNGARTVVLDDPSCLDDDLDDCTNPFNVQNNVRIRDVVIAHGEMDLDSGRKGMAIVEVAARFKKDYRLPLGGVPNLSEERLMKKMSAVETVEWTVEKMGDGVCYVIVLPETLNRAYEVGPGSPSTPSSAEKPKSSGVSPAAKRMFGFALKEAMSVNNRQTGTREKVLAERQESPIYRADSGDDPIAVADSDGDPVMPPSPVPPAPYRHMQTAPAPERVMDRSAMMALSDHDVLDPSLEARAGSMRILRTQTPRGSTGSSPSSISSTRGRGNGPQSRAVRPESSSNMWSSQPSAPAKPSVGFGRGPVPTFGTFKTAPPPAAADKKDDYEVAVSDIIEPSESNLASKLPGMFKPAAAPSFPSKFATAAPISTISFGTSSQSVPSPSSAPRPAVPSFGTIASPAQSSFPSAFGGPTNTPTTTPAVSPPKKLIEVISSPKKMVEVIGESKNKVNGAELLGATIQLIGRLRSGAKVFLNEIERTPVEEVVANNHDFFDIDEKDERIHLLHKDVDPNLLQYENQTLGELAKETKKEEAPPVPETKAGAFSRPGPPSFNHLPEPPAATASPAFSRPSESAPVAAAPRTVPTFAKPTLGPVPSFGTANRPVKVVEDEERPASATSIRTEASEPAKPRPGMPTFGAAPRKLIEVVEEKKAESRPEAVPLDARSTEAASRPASAMSTASSYSSTRAEPRPGMPSFGTKSLDVRPDSAMSNRTEEPKKVLREVPTFARPVERTESAMSARSEKIEDRTQDNDSSASSTISSSEPPPSLLDPSLSLSASLETLDVEDKEDEDLRLAMEQSLALELEKEKDLLGPHAFPTHKDIRRLCVKQSLALDSIRKGKLYMGSVITSFNPNRLIMTIVEEDAVANMTAVLGQLRKAYLNYSPALNDSVEVGQFAIAVSGEKDTGLIVRVVVLRKTDAGTFECACLDINALVCVEGSNLYALMDRFSVHEIPSTTFVARINGLPQLTERGHQAMKLIAKCSEYDPNIMSTQPFVFHGKDVTTGDLVVDVAALILDDCRWLGEALPEILQNVGKNPEAPMNPDIKHAIQFAKEHGLEQYGEVKTRKDDNGEDEEDSRTLRSESVEQMQERPIPKIVVPPSKKDEVLDSDDEIEKEDGELDSSHDSAASAKTMVDKHAAGDFARGLKEEVVDEFVVAAPSAVKPIIDVESMTGLIRRFNENGENLEVEVIKSMCRALILSVNKTLNTLGDRGTLIANAEALEAIEME